MGASSASGSGSGAEIGIKKPDTLRNYMDLSRGGTKSEVIFFDKEWKTLDNAQKKERLENHQKVCDLQAAAKDTK
jgi:hypothetical protein